jgi:hypothetical protein
MELLIGLPYAFMIRTWSTEIAYNARTANNECILYVKLKKFYFILRCWLGKNIREFNVNYLRGINMRAAEVNNEFA